MSTEHEPEVQQIVYSNRRELEQLPTITPREFAERAFIFLFSCYSTALVVQVLTFVPIVSPVTTRIPWIVLGILLLVAGVQSALKRPLTKLLLLGILLGSVVGL